MSERQDSVSSDRGDGLKEQVGRAHFLRSVHLCGLLKEVRPILGGWGKGEGGSREGRV